VAVKVVRSGPGDFVVPWETPPVMHAAPEAGNSRGEETVRPPRAGRENGEADEERRPAESPSIRSTERRHWTADLLGPATAGLMLHGVGGIGKSALAAEIVARAGRLQPERMTTVIGGEVTTDGFLAGLAAALRRHPMAESWAGPRAAAVAAADRIDLPWDHRLASLRRYVLGRVPVLMCLDDFDDNLSTESGSWAVGDPALAGLLAGWADGAHQGRLLITCREPFALPGTAGRAFGWRRLGPLSRSGAAKLAMSLPALGQLDEEDFDQAWRLTAGHPRAMEYLDAVLWAGQARFPDVARRLRGAIQARTGRTVGRTGPDAPTGLPPATAETVALAAADLLLGDLSRRLSAAALDLLTGASVYREPVGCHAPLLPDGQHGRATEPADLAAECDAAGLLTLDRRGEPPTVFVHRWTASELHRRLAGTKRGGEVTGAHRRAAEYWQERATAAPDDGHAAREAGYHRLRAGDGAGQDQPAAGRAGPAMRRHSWLAGLAAAAVVAALALVTAVAAGAWPAASPGPARPPAHVAAPASGAAAIRAEVAAWVAQQVSRDAILACDPAMCSALLAHGIASGKLLVLRSSASDPLGSDVVMATAAVRSLFGARLAGVYAPAVIASFGSGAVRIDVRAIAPDGAAAYRRALAADLAARREAGAQLLRNPRIAVSAAARRELATGTVDPRLLMTLAAVAAAEPVRVTAFAGSGPGASAGVPLRGMEVAGPTLRSILAFVRAQRPPYLPARAGIVPGVGSRPVLSIEFGAPSPVGLLQPQPSP
jgi:hypothetical protein